MIDELDPKTERVTEPPKRWDCVFLSLMDNQIVLCDYCNRSWVCNAGDTVYPCCYPYPSRDVAETSAKDVESGSEGGLLFVQAERAP